MKKKYVNKMYVKYKLFLDHSYSHIHDIGYISIDIYEDDQLMSSEDMQYFNIQCNSEVLKNGINICHNFVENNEITSYAIYSDCLSFIQKYQPKNVLFVKKHANKKERTRDELKFRRVDVRSRQRLRNTLQMDEIST